MMDWSVPVKADTPFETANGYEITLSEASLNHWIVQLTPCQPSSESLELGLNLSTLAWAGHSVGDEALEVSQVLGPMSEDLTEGGAWVLSPERSTPRVIVTHTGRSRRYRSQSPTFFPHCDYAATGETSMVMSVVRSASIRKSTGAFSWH